MALATSPAEIYAYLGKPRIQPGDPLLNDMPDAVNAQVDSIIVQLHQIDEAITQARLDSMAVVVDKLKVDYVAHIAVLKSEASRLLRRLSALTLVPVYFDSYSKSQPGQSPYSFVSYW